LRSPEAKAAALLARLEITKIPVPVKSVAEKLGAFVVPSGELDASVAGLLIRDAKRGTVICYRAADSRTRQRFTIAHEIAHLILHPGRPLLIESSIPIEYNARTPTAGYGTPVEETEANQFAAALLMPQFAIDHEVQNAIYRSGIDNEAIGRLARHFGVSPSALQYRLINLGLYIPS